MKCLIFKGILDNFNEVCDLFLWFWVGVEEVKFFFLMFDLMFGILLELIFLFVLFDNFVFICVFEESVIFCLVVVKLFFFLLL